MDRKTTMTRDQRRTMTSGQRPEQGGGYNDWKKKSRLPEQTNKSVVGGGRSELVTCQGMKTIQPWFSPARVHYKGLRRG